MPIGFPFGYCQWPTEPKATKYKHNQKKNKAARKARRISRTR